MAADNAIPEITVLDKNKDGVTHDVSLVHPSSHGEPIVTRRELWSYYCKPRKDSRRPYLIVHPQCTLTAVPYVSSISLLFEGRLLRKHNLGSSCV